MGDLGAGSRLIRDELEKISGELRFCFLVVFGDKAHYVAQASLRLTVIVPPRSPTCWACRSLHRPVWPDVCSSAYRIPKIPLFVVL